MRWAVFLDRDGTVNKEVGYLDSPERLRLIHGVAKAIRLLNQAGVPAILVTNQSAISRGYFTEDCLVEIHHALALKLAVHGAHLDAIYYCPHRPDEGCACRKPNSAMLKIAAKDHDIDLSRSFVVGDKMSDLEAGHQVECRTVLVLTGYGTETQEQIRNFGFQPDFTARDLLAAVRWILIGEEVANS